MEPDTIPIFFRPLGALSAAVVTPFLVLMASVGWHCGKAGVGLRRRRGGLGHGLNRGRVRHSRSARRAAGERTAHRAAGDVERDGGITWSVTVVGATLKPGAAT